MAPQPVDASAEQLNQYQYPNVPSSLKKRCLKWLVPFALAGATIIAWLNLGMPDSPADALSFGWPEWLRSMVAPLAVLFVSAVNAVPGNYLKEVLVFWRIKNPLPGARAFEKVTLHSDPRINPSALRAKLGGEFPRGAQDQNSKWYELYISLRNDPAVNDANYRYLLFRDLTWLTVLLLAAVLISIPFNWASALTLFTFLLVLGCLYFLFGRAAEERGRRLVTTVLAIASAKFS